MTSCKNKRPTTGARRLVAPFLVLALAVAAPGCAEDTAKMKTQITSACPLMPGMSWIDGYAGISDNDGSPFLGCANRQNLEKMIVDPRDLVRGRILDAADGERESNGIAAYKQSRKGSGQPDQAMPAPVLSFRPTSSGATQ
jgi:hypothetical protein